MTHQPKREIALLLLFTLPALLLFTPLANPHSYCSGCPGPGSSGICQYCHADHPFGSHGSETPPPPPPPPTTQEECDAAKKKCEEAKKAAAAARETALIVCGVAAIEPSPAGELACSLYLIRAGAKATYATLVCLTAKSICSRVA